MKKIALLKNTIQPYAWGSRTAIPELLGEKNPSPTPQAELWMGAHPKAPSLVKCNGQWHSLKDLIEQDPGNILGNKVAKLFHNRLPYLFKVLAAARALSFQAHPTRPQAVEGFERENRQGIPLDDAERNYKDDNHKPECICALSNFVALYGFRAISEILALIEKNCPNGLGRERAHLAKRPDAVRLKHFFTGLMSLKPEQRKRVVDESVKNAARCKDQDPVCAWILKLADQYPDDVGILSPLYLNLVQLGPGQALFLPAGQLHAYLEGFGIELMANSDNVLRGGLTGKHVDVPELLKVLTFEPRRVQILEPMPADSNERFYVTPAEEFVLSVIYVSSDRPYRSSDHRSIEILLCIEGRALLRDNHSENGLEITKGMSVVIPAALENYRLTGQATLYKAAVPF